MVIQKFRVRYPGAQSVVSLSKTPYLHNLALVSRNTLLRMSARVYNIYHFEDASPPMLDLYVCLFYSLNKLRSWFIISDAEVTKTEHFT